MYERKTRLDTTPIHIMQVIEGFYRRVVPISPNKRDVVKRRHPLYPTQVMTKQALLCYQTSNELWHQFIEEHHGVAMGMQNKNQPNTAPIIFCDNVPWEMRKVKDSGCLYKQCGSFHLFHIGMTCACAAIYKILTKMQNLNNITAEVTGQINVLVKIKDVIATPSKHNTCVKCLKPCLRSEKLENAAYTCLNKHDCGICGLR